MTLFFDTETNGLPKKMNAPAFDVNNWPRIIQLAFVVMTDEGQEVFSFCNLIKPEGWEIPKQEFWIKHGYSTEKNAAEGVPVREALQKMVESINSCHTIVAHNIAFDFPIVAAEMIRAGLKADRKPEKLCTMKTTTDLVKLPSPRGFGFKWPKLQELHHYLFNMGFDGAHDALEDVRATSRCYFELVKRGHFPAPELI